MKSILSLYSENPASLKYQVFLVYFAPVCRILVPFLPQDRNRHMSIRAACSFEPAINRPWSHWSSKSCLRRNDRKQLPQRMILSQKKTTMNKMSCAKTHNVIFANSATRQNPLSLLAPELALQTFVWPLLKAIQRKKDTRQLSRWSTPLLCNSLPTTGSLRIFEF